MAVFLHQGDLPDGLSFGDSVAVDTETLGLNPHRDRLCLVQLSDGNGDAHLVQIAKNQRDAVNLRKVLEDQNCVKLFHYARFDVAILWHNLGIAVNPVYCTKIASKLTRTYTERHGLKDLVKETVGLDLSKQQQSSDWGAETLSEAQMNYAASDVLHLHQAKKVLDAWLIREGRMDYAKACFDFIPTRARLDLMGWEEHDIFAHS